jgi:hypothetical protein
MPLTEHGARNTMAARLLHSVRLESLTYAGAQHGRGDCAPRPIRG